MVASFLLYKFVIKLIDTLVLSFLNKHINFFIQWCQISSENDPSYVWLLYNVFQLAVGRLDSLHQLLWHLRLSVSSSVLWPEVHWRQTVCGEWLFLQWTRWLPAPECEGVQSGGCVRHMACGRLEPREYKALVGLILSNFIVHLCLYSVICSYFFPFLYWLHSHLLDLCLISYTNKTLTLERPLCLYVNCCEIHAVTTELKMTFIDSHFTILLMYTHA